MVGRTKSRTALLEGKEPDVHPAVPTRTVPQSAEREDPLVAAERKQRWQN